MFDSTSRLTLARDNLALGRRRKAASSWSGMVRALRYEAILEIFPTTMPLSLNDRIRLAVLWVCLGSTDGRSVREQDLYTNLPDSVFSGFQFHSRRASERGQCGCEFGAPTPKGTSLLHFMTEKMCVAARRCGWSRTRDGTVFWQRYVVELAWAEILLRSTRGWWSPDIYVPSCCAVLG